MQPSYEKLKSLSELHDFVGKNAQYIRKICIRFKCSAQSLDKIGLVPRTKTIRRQATKNRTVREKYSVEKDEPRKFDNVTKIGTNTVF